VRTTALQALALQPATQAADPVAVPLLSLRSAASPSLCSPAPTPPPQNDDDDENNNNNNNNNNNTRARAPLRSSRSIAEAIDTSGEIRVRNPAADDREPAKTFTFDHVFGPT